jgi:PAS domain S-box-containing protein
MKKIKTDRGEKQRRLLQEYIFNLEDAQEKAEELAIAHEKLKQSQEFLMAVLGCTTHGVCLIRNGAFVWCNKALTDILGWELGEMIGKSAGAIHPVVVDDKRGNVIYDNFPHTKSVMRECELMHKDGHRVPCLIAGHFMDEDDHSRGYVLSITDFTERKKTEEELVKHRDHLEEMVKKRTAALQLVNDELRREINQRQLVENALKESKNWYRAIFENTGTATVILDEKTTILLANAEYEKLSGFTRVELEGKKSWTEFVEEEDLDRMMKSHKLRRHDKDAAPKSYEFRFRDRNGHVKNILLTIDMVPGTGRSVASLLDITERKKAEEEKRKNEEFIATLIKTMPDIVVRTDIKGQILFVNEIGLKKGGYFREDIVGHNILSFVLPEEQGIAADNMLNMIQQRLSPVEYHLVGKDGRKVLFEVNGRILKDENDSPCGFVFICRDITERRRMEEARQRLEERVHRAEKMEVLGTLAGGVAHDLNNVLGVLIGYSELLLEKVPGGSQLRRYAENILKSGQKGAAIIQDLLTLARRGVAVSEVINLNDIVSGYLKSPEYEKLMNFYPRITFNALLDNDLLNIKGSSVHLEKTVLNLLSNAAEAISNCGNITIRTENRYLDKPIQGYDHLQEGDYVVLQVSDNGDGISSEDIEKIFEPFYTKKVMGKSGTGLGLAVVWGTVKDHEGYIDVLSEEGKGTVFSLYFPVTREEKTEGDLERLSVESYMGKGESILVVDDVREQRELAVTILSRLGYRVNAVSSGEDAVAYLKTETVDLMVLDMIMEPGIDGLETYKRVLEINPNQKAVIVSGFSETEQVENTKKLGAGRYIRKPYIMEKIGLAIRDELLK